jgi:PAS domain-containing protein
MVDGCSIEVETLKTPFYNEEGTLIGLIGVSRDITNRKMAQEQLQIKEKILTNVAAATNELLINSDYYTAIDRCLALRGEATGVERVVLLETQMDDEQGYLCVRSIWDSVPQHCGLIEPGLRHIPMRDIPFLAEAMRNGKALRGLEKILQTV